MNGLWDLWQGNLVYLIQSVIDMLDWVRRGLENTMVLSVSWVQIEELLTFVTIYGIDLHLAKVIKISLLDPLQLE